MKQGFGDSFLVRLIREFFLLLVVVALLELLIRFGVELVDFYVEEPKAVADRSEALAADVQSLMLNRGGPVAAQTMYPILDKTHEQVGYEIAIVPSEVTVTSIEKRFDFEPRGIPARWSEGIHHADRIELRAEAFCTTCHVDAGIGDVLGHVEVRKYLFEDISRWWHEIQLTTIASMGKIILHTIVLYILLQIRMEPLNSLRTMVGRLAQSGARLEERAPVRSRDEFGQLADDMNAFLDRVAGITADVESVLERISRLNVRLNEVRSRIEGQTETLRQRVDDLPAAGAIDCDLAAALRDTLESLAAQVQPGTDLGQRLHASAEQLDALARRRAEPASPEAEVPALRGDLAALSRHVAEMAVLEERMQAIAEEGSRLLGRLVGPDNGSARDDDDAAGPAQDEPGGRA